MAKKWPEMVVKWPNTKAVSFLSHQSLSAYPGLYTSYTPIQYKRYYLWVWPFYDYFWSFFGKLHEYLSQNLVTGGHFEVLKLSKSQLDQKLQQKTEVLLFPFFFNFGRKNPENLWLLKWPFLTIFGHFFANYMKIFHKFEVQKVILRC